MEKQEFTKEQLDAIKIVDRLYELNKDVELAWKLFIEKTKENKIKLCSLEKTKVQFNSSVPTLFLSFVEAIEKGDLIFKKDIQ